MRPQIFYVHIEKTAGSSLVKSLIEPNVECLIRVQGGMHAFLSYLKARDADCVYGHVPYGLHRLSLRPVQYITFLREPVDRSVSYFYFIRETGRLNPHKPHPFRDYADSVTIEQFYKNPVHADRQARYLAGMSYHKAYPYLYKNQRFRQQLIQKAKSHLQNCLVFGLQEYYVTSTKLLQQKLAWPNFVETRRRSVTQNRPKMDQLRRESPEIATSLKRYHALDYELYEYARRLFANRIEEAGLVLPNASFNQIEES